jgi:hypothetical protein
LNCRLGYRTDSKGCLLCECQSCPAMDQCQKNCPTGYLKDLFACDICECNDPCPPFSCDIRCPSDLGFVKSKDGCPLCQCVSKESKPNRDAFSCQVQPPFATKRKKMRSFSFHRATYTALLASAAFTMRPTRQYAKQVETTKPNSTSSQRHHESLRVDLMMFRLAHGNIPLTDGKETTYSPSS